MQRALKTSVNIPIIFGSIAFYLGKKSDEYATHRWTLYLRGPGDEDLSVFVSKVVFTLHPSFAEPIREIDRSPFEVTETGWGEFEAGIRIFFRDQEELPIDLYHTIKLYPPGPPQPLSMKKPVVSETYDEIIFTDPHDFFLKQLMLFNPSQTRPSRPSTLPVEYSTVFDDERDISTLVAIRDHVLRETEVAKNRLLQLESEIALLQDVTTVARALPSSAVQSHQNQLVQLAAYTQTNFPVSNGFPFPVHDSTTSS